jgi:hypothetical protein
MEDSTRDEGSAKKMKYIQPELIPLDKDTGVMGANCTTGSSASDACLTGGIPFSSNG